MSQGLRFKRALALSAACAFFATACSSTGGNRVSSVGQPVATGPQGPQGATGTQGATGPQGAAGEDGADGRVNAGQSNLVATGGLIGPNGLGGTGLLANTGDPENGNELISEGLVLTGDAASLAAGSAFFSASLVDSMTPGGTPIVGTVLGVADETGQTLVQTGNGEIYLVDGLLAAPGDLITATIGDTMTIGGGEESLLGVSLLSGDQQEGSLVTLGASADGELVTLDTAVTGDVVGGVEDTVGGVTEVLPVSGDGDLGGVTGPLGGALDDPTGPLEDIVDDGGGLLGGLLGNN